MLETLEQPRPGTRQPVAVGTGDVHITFTWRSGTSGREYGGVFEGILPSLLDKYRSFAEQDATAAVGKVHAQVIHCTDCDGAGLDPQAEGRNAHHAAPTTTAQAQMKFVRCRSARPWRPSELDLDPTRTFIAAEVLKEIRGRLS